MAKTPTTETEEARRRQAESPGCRERVGAGGKLEPC
jgi:hypothetical protein